MADIHIVPPVDDSPAALDIFFQQICEQLNPATDMVEDGGLPTDIPTDITGLIASGGFGSIVLNFSDVTYEGHSYTLFTRATDGIFGNSIPVGSTTTNRFVDTIADPVIGTTYTYWAKNVNLRGDSSVNWSSAASASVSADVDYSIDLLLGKLGYEEFDSANGVYPIRTEDTLPVLPDALYPINSTIVLTTNQKLYVNRANVWKYKVEAGDVESNAIEAGTIAAGALVVDDGVMQNGYIKTALIEDAQITSAKVVSLEADKISAGTISVSLVLTAATVVGGIIKTNSDVVANGGVIIQNDVITVYDDSGNVRVKIGDLS